MAHTFKPASEDELRARGVLPPAEPAEPVKPTPKPTPKPKPKE